jgi:hypothetical protein
VTNALALLRLLPLSDRDKDAEILALRNQILVLERQLHGDRVEFTRADRPGSRPCCTRYREQCWTTCGCWSVRRPCCAGTVI